MRGKNMESCRGVSKNFVVLCAGVFALAANLSRAGSCEPVADLVVKNKTDLTFVSVKRHSGTERVESIPITVLCVDDEVSVSGGKGRNVFIRYRSNPPGEVPFPANMVRVTVPVLQTNSVKANAWKAFNTWLFNRDGGITQVSLDTRAPRTMTSALSRGEDTTRPYYVVPDIDEFHFFWSGGQAPWKLEIADAQGNLKVSLESIHADASFRLAGKAGDYFTLSIQSAEGRRLARSIVFEQGPVNDSTLPIDSWSRLFPLMADMDRNWRLYLWSVMRRMPDSEIKTIVVQHLKNDDI